MSTTFSTISSLLFQTCQAWPFYKGYFAILIEKGCGFQRSTGKKTVLLHWIALCPTFILFLSQEVLIQCRTLHSVPMLLKGRVSCYCWAHFGCFHSPCGSTRIAGGIKRHKWGKETTEDVIADEVSRRLQARPCRLLCGVTPATHTPAPTSTAYSARSVAELTQLIISSESVTLRAHRIPDLRPEHYWSDWARSDLLWSSDRNSTRTRARTHTRQPWSRTGEQPSRLHADINGVLWNESVKELAGLHARCREDGAWAVSVAEGAQWWACACPFGGGFRLYLARWPNKRAKINPSHATQTLQEKKGGEAPHRVAQLAVEKLKFMSSNVHLH